MRSVPPQEWSRYIDDIYAVPSLARANDSAELGFVNGMRQRIANYQYTPAERDQVLLDFLRRLEAAKAKGEIKGTVRFILHQRLWFRSDSLARNPGYRMATENGFSGDMANFINAARGECLDHWIAGIRLGEHSNKNMDEILPIIAELAHQVNDKTGGWLRKHLMVANGGGWGAYYRGINQVQEHVRDIVGVPFDFFHTMASQTGSFAFGYKWMDSNVNRQQRVQIGVAILGQQCDGANAGPHECRADSDADWQSFLDRGLGFGELAAFVHAHAAAYPNHANVVFVGDSSDSVQQMVVQSGNGLADRPPLVALRRLIVNAAKGGGDWTGRLFMNGYSNWDQLKDGGLGPSGRVNPDLGRTLYFLDGSPDNFQMGKVALMANSYAEWQRWPAAPGSAQ
jgi:hypothetical protein